MRRLAPTYASNDPCQSRWSGARFNRTETRGCRDSWSASWKDDASTTSTSWCSRAAVGNGLPMLPHATASSPPARRQAAIMPDVVVFPFVPVTARYGTRPSPAPSSHPPQIGMSRSRAHLRTSADGGIPGLVTTSVAPSGWGRSWPPARIFARSASTVWRSPSCPRGRASVITTEAPSFASAPAAAIPATPAPITTARSPENVPLTTSAPRAGSSSSQASPCDEVGVEQTDPDRRTEPRDDPEPNDHGELRPASELEMVVDRGHPEDATTEPTERDHLRDHRERLQHEESADDDQQDRGVRHECERAEEPTERERARIAHEDARRGRVPPEEPSRGAGHRGRDDRRVLQVHTVHGVSAGRALQQHARVAELPERDEHVGATHHDGRAGGQTIESVREVHRVRRGGEH